jgi:hypothetical protein
MTNNVKCQWCAIRFDSLTCPEVCPIDAEVRLAIASFAASHGRRWKSALRDLWSSGRDADPNLRRARNLIGPSGLDRITASVLESTKSIA